MPMKTPGGVLDLIMKEDIFIDEDQARADFLEYRKQQVLADKVQRKQAKREHRAPDVLPPCFDCLPILHAYCRKTELKCKPYHQWLHNGRYQWPNPKPVKEKPKKS
jgi:hypothetical protein